MGTIRCLSVVFCAKIGVLCKIAVWIITSINPVIKSIAHIGTPILTIAEKFLISILRKSPSFQLLGLFQDSKFLQISHTSYLFSPHVFKCISQSKQIGIVLHGLLLRGEAILMI